VVRSFATRHEIDRITNILRLLTLPEKVQTLVRAGKVSAGHARVLIGRSGARRAKCACGAVCFRAWRGP